MREFHETWGDFRISTYGGGLSIVVVHTPSGRTLALQDDEVERFEAERDSVEAAHPDWGYRRVYAWLWDQCAWGMAAEPP